VADPLGADGGLTADGEVPLDPGAIGPATEYAAWWQPSNGPRPAVRIRGIGPGALCVIIFLDDQVFQAQPLDLPHGWQASAGGQEDPICREPMVALATRASGRVTFDAIDTSRFGAPTLVSIHARVEFAPTSALPAVAILDVDRLPVLKSGPP
jgi:hypothetical protein